MLGQLRVGIANKRGIQYNLTHAIKQKEMNAIPVLSFLGSSMQERPRPDRHSRKVELQLKERYIDRYRLHRVDFYMVGFWR